MSSPRSSGGLVCWSRTRSQLERGGSWRYELGRLGCRWAVVQGTVRPDGVGLSSPSLGEQLAFHGCVEDLPVGKFVACAFRLIWTAVLLDGERSFRSL